RESSVEDRNAQDHERHNQGREEVCLAGKDLRRVPTDEDRRGRHQEPEEVGTAIAHEDASFQFHGRNPSETPAVAAAISGPTFEDSSVPLRTALKLKMKNAIDASATNPAAKPSISSTKLTALAMPITHTTASIAATARIS